MAEQSPEAVEIVETSDATFEVDVIARSELGLVLVDFWAEWCAPCRMLGPILEKLAGEYRGSLTLVKANTEAAPEAAGRFGVTGIPAVFAVLDGQTIDSFQGALPEESIRSWLDSLLSKAETVNAIRLAETSPAAAEEKLRAILSRSPHDAQVAIALAKVLVNLEREDESRQMIAELERRGFLEPEAEQLKAQLDLAQKSDVDLDAVRAAAEAAPTDFGKQFALAEALAGHQQYQAAFEICLELVAKDRQRTGEQARALMVEVFRVLPEDSELTSEYRRKLSMALY